MQKKLFPNVDFYASELLQTIGFPTSMLTVLFAIGRTVGPDISMENLERLK